MVTSSWLGRLFNYGRTLARGSRACVRCGGGRATAPSCNDISIAAEQSENCCCPFGKRAQLLHNVKTTTTKIATITAQPETTTCHRIPSHFISSAFRNNGFPSARRFESAVGQIARTAKLIRTRFDVAVRSGSIYKAVKYRSFYNQLSDVNWSHFGLSPCVTKTGALILARRDFCRFVTHLRTTAALKPRGHRRIQWRCYAKDKNTCGMCVRRQRKPKTAKECEEVCQKICKKHCKRICKKIEAKQGRKMVKRKETAFKRRCKKQMMKRMAKRSKACYTTNISKCHMVKEGGKRCFICETIQDKLVATIQRIRPCKIAKARIITPKPTKKICPPITTCKPKKIVCRPQQTKAGVSKPVKLKMKPCYNPCKSSGSQVCPKHGPIGSGSKVCSQHGPICPKCGICPECPKSKPSSAKPKPRCDPPNPCAQKPSKPKSKPSSKSESVCSGFKPKKDACEGKPFWAPLNKDSVCKPKVCKPPKLKITQGPKLGVCKPKPQINPCVCPPKPKPKPKIKDPCVCPTPKPKPASAPKTVSAPKPKPVTAPAKPKHPSEPVCIPPCPKVTCKAECKPDPCKPGVYKPVCVCKPKSPGGVITTRITSPCAPKPYPKCQILKPKICVKPKKTWKDVVASKKACKTVCQPKPKPKPKVKKVISKPKKSRCPNWKAKDSCSSKPVWSPVEPKRVCAAQTQTPKHKPGVCEPPPCPPRRHGKPKPKIIVSKPPTQIKVGGKPSGKTHVGCIFTCKLVVKPGGEAVCKLGCKRIKADGTSESPHVDMSVKVGDIPSDKAKAVNCLTVIEASQQCLKRYDLCKGGKITADQLSSILREVIGGGTKKGPGGGTPTLMGKSKPFSGGGTAMSTKPTVKVGKPNTGTKLTSGLLMAIKSASSAVKCCLETDSTRSRVKSATGSNTVKPIVGPVKQKASTLSNGDQLRKAAMGSKDSVKLTMIESPARDTGRKMETAVAPQKGSTKADNYPEMCKPILFPAPIIKCPPSLMRSRKENQKTFQNVVAHFKKSAQSKASGDTLSADKRKRFQCKCLKGPPDKPRPPKPKALPTLPAGRRKKFECKCLRGPPDKPRTPKPKGLPFGSIKCDVVCTPVKDPKLEKEMNCLPGSLLKCTVCCKPISGRKNPKNNK